MSQNLQIEQCCGQEDNIKVAKEQSLEDLVIWNIAKALQKDPHIAIKTAIRAMHDNLSLSAKDYSTISQESPEQYLTCALLAWQQLGNASVDSLYSFIETHRNEINSQGLTSAMINQKLKADMLNEPTFHRDILPPAVLPARTSIGEVVKLPLSSKRLVMRLDQPQQMSAKQSRNVTQPSKEVCQDMQFLKELECLCQKECTACTKRLVELEEKEIELRSRAEQIVAREVARAELLEKAAAAWVDLEAKYHSRLNAAKEQAEIVINKMEREMKQRKCMKRDCKVLVEELKELSTAAEEMRLKLQELEQQACQRACQRMRMMEEAQQADAVFADEQCKEAQFDRDLKFKEQQAQRKLFTVGSDLDSAYALTVESERALRAELTALKAQIENVSEQLLVEDSTNIDIKEELQELRTKKDTLLNTFEGCKDRCDKLIETDVQNLKAKEKELADLEKKVVECKCKAPVAKMVEVKRTPSLATTCTCIDEGFDSSCRCAPLGASLLSNLLSSLFRGLQSELGDAGIMMPCPLLKCLEDGHNWDRNTPVKSKLKDFFSQLLIGELDIAIAVSIEKYHARWVGATCADMRAIPNVDPEQAREMQDKAIEKTAQRLASKLAEDLFKERAEELTQNAKEICELNPTSCDCEPKDKEAAVYSCVVSQNINLTNTHRGLETNKTKPKRTNWKQTQKAVEDMKAEIENLKKASVKKQDIRMFEEKIKRVIKAGTVNPNEDSTKRNKIDSKILTDICKFRPKVNKDFRLPERYRRDKASETSRILGQSFAVNVCLCDQPKKPLVKQNSAKRKYNKKSCPSTCVCLNCEPNNESLDKFIEDWNNNLKETGVNLGGCRLMKIIKNCFLDSQFNEKNIGDVAKKLHRVVVEPTTDCEQVRNSKLENGHNSFGLSKENQKTQRSDIQAVTNFPQECNASKSNEIPENLKTKIVGSQEKKSRQETKPDQAEKGVDCKCSCFCESDMKICISREKNKFINKNKENNECECNVDRSVFAIIKETLVKSLGPILGIQENDDKFCKCFNERIDKSIKNILGTVDLKKCKCKICECVKNGVEFKNSRNKPIPAYDTIYNSGKKGDTDFCECNPCKCDVDADEKSKKHLKNKPKYRHESAKKQQTFTSSSGESSDETFSGSETDITDEFNDTQTNKKLIKKKATDKISTSSTDESVEKKVDSSKHLKKNKENNKQRKIKYQDNNGNKESSDMMTLPLEVSTKHKKVNDKNIIKEQNTDEVRQNNPANTNSETIVPVQSEYIGTVNLEKSNDISKLSSSMCCPTLNGTQIKTIGDAKDTICDCDEPSIAVVSTLNKKINRQNSGGDSKLGDENMKNVNPTDIIMDEECCCDYKIKLLGVTLTGGNKRRNKKDYDKTKMFKIATNETFPKLDEKSVKNSNKPNDVAMQIQKTSSDEIKCFCCSETKQESKQDLSDLEENTFSLLEEYMKKRLEEYRLNCKSECFNPELEQKMMNEIFKHVKQTVSDNVKQIDCYCCNETPKEEQSKNRAYNLLQEYLKMKVDRVKCQCVSAKAFKGNVVVDMYKNVCDQIENDFLRIKNLCACKNNNENTKKENVIFEIPERDTNNQATQPTSSLKQMVSAQNSPLTQKGHVNSNSSSARTKKTLKETACGPLAKQFKHVQTGQSITCTCQSFECCTNPKLLEKQYTIQQCAEVFVKSIGKQDDSEGNSLEILKLTSKTSVSGESTKSFIQEAKPAPYIGYTINCSCACLNSNPCSCPKCLVLKNKIFTKDIWSIYNRRKLPSLDYSYIMDKSTNAALIDKNYLNVSAFSNAEYIAGAHVYQRDEKCGNSHLGSLLSDEMVLKMSKENIRLAARAINTSSLSEDALKVDSHGSPYKKLFDINYHNCLHNRFKDVGSGVSLSRSSCECRKVPVCHVKLLMKHLESRLEQAGCTCDALHPSVCPVHYSTL